MSAERVAAYAEALLGIARAEGHVEEIRSSAYVYSAEAHLDPRHQVEIF